MSKVITKSETIILDSSGIVKCCIHDDYYLELDDAKENIEAIKQFGNGKPIPVLVDIRESKGGSKESRAYFASEETGKIQSACALIVSSPLSRLIGNFFIGLNKTKFPTKLFLKEDEAVAWLKTFL
jgi:hypothetical protein